jgi:hypothetical protein
MNGYDITNGHDDKGVAGGYGDFMADLYLKKIQSERNALWASARMKGLPKDTPERIRIADLDAQIAAHKAKVKAKKAE